MYSLVRWETYAKQARMSSCMKAVAPAASKPAPNVSATDQNNSHKDGSCSGQTLRSKCRDVSSAVYTATPPGGRSGTDTGKAGPRNASKGASPNWSCITMWPI